MTSSAKFKSVDFPLDGGPAINILIDSSAKTASIINDFINSQLLRFGQKYFISNSNKTSFSDSYLNNE